MSVSKKNIIFLAKSLEAGGAENEFVNVANNLNPLLFRPIVVLLKKKGVQLAKLKRHIPIYEVRHKGPWSIPSAIGLLTVLINRFHPKSVISFENISNMLNSVMKKIYKHNLKVILFQGGVLSDRIPGWSYSHLRSKLSKSLYPLADYVVASSPVVADDLIKNFRVNPERTAVIPSSIDFSLKKTTVRSRRQTHSQTISFVGRLINSKRVDLLINAFSLISSKYPRLRLKIVGDGPQRRYLEKYAASFMLLDRVVFTGEISNVNDVLFETKLLVLPSDTEGSPKVVLEAMAASVPVVTTAWSGVCHQIEHLKTGLIIKTGSAGELAEAIELLITNPQFADSIIISAKKHVLKFDIKKTIKKYEELLI